MVIKKDKLVVILFCSESFKPSTDIEPKFDKLAKQVKDHSALYKVNIDENEDVAKEYGVFAVPTF